jgi:hypothetical protein
MNTSQFKERSTTFIEEDSAMVKLRHCENEIKYFKATVQQMAESTFGFMKKLSSCNRGTSPKATSRNGISKKLPCR